MLSFKRLKAWIRRYVRRLVDARLQRRYKPRYSFKRRYR